MSPILNSFLPISIIALFNVSPCALWIVIAHASFSGSCNLEQGLPQFSHVRLMGTIGTDPSTSVGPE